MAIQICNDYGLGAFLTPPTYPAHTTSILVNGERFSLLGATYSNKIPVSARIIARKVLEAWEPGEIDRKWLHNVLGYYENTWRNPKLKEPDCWYGCNAFFCENPIGATNDDHFGVRHVRRFYPNFTPTQDDWDHACWDGKTAFESRDPRPTMEKDVLYHDQNSFFSITKPDESTVIGTPRLPYLGQTTTSGFQTVGVVQGGKYQSTTVTNPAFNLP